MIFNLHHQSDKTHYQCPLGVKPEICIKGEAKVEMPLFWYSRVNFYTAIMPIPYSIAG
jgi:hypothetical protein